MINVINHVHGNPEVNGNALSRSKIKYFFVLVLSIFMGIMHLNMLSASPNLYGQFYY